MDQKAYVICATYGEYDDFTRIPMFICPMQIEADLFVDALNARERPCFDKVIKFFEEYYGRSDGEKCVPDGVGFEWHELDVLTLCEQHTNKF